MEELYKELRMQTEAHYLTIKETNDKIEHIRANLCTHPEEYIEIGNYEWRTGSIHSDAKICGVCGKLLDLPDPYQLK